MNLCEHDNLEIDEPRRLFIVHALAPDGVKVVQAFFDVLEAKDYFLQAHNCCPQAALWVDVQDFTPLMLN